MTLPAVAGGSPVRNIPLSYTLPCVGPDDIQAVTVALSGNVLSMGKAIYQFELAFASYTGARYAVAVARVINYYSL